MRDGNASVGLFRAADHRQSPAEPMETRTGGFCKLADHWAGSRVVKVFLFRLFCLEKQDLFSEKEQKSAAVAEGVGLCASPVNGLLNTKKTSLLVAPQAHMGHACPEVSRKFKGTSAVCRVWILPVSSLIFPPSVATNGQFSFVYPPSIWSITELLNI